MKNKKVIILISIIIVVICIVGCVSIYKYNSKVDYNKYFNRTINNKVNKKICLDKLCIDNMQIIDEKNLEIINQVLAEKRNLGFSIIILNDGLSNLPNECSNFIVLDENKSAIIENDLNINKQKTFMLPV